MLFLETFSTMGKTGMYEGVQKKTKGLSVGFNITFEHYKQIVRLTDSKYLQSFF